MKQQLRKLWLLALCALMSVANAWADASVGTAAELKTAIEELNVDNQTITLTAKITLTENITCSHSFTLALGNYSITKGNYSIALADDVTVKVQSKVTYFSTSTNGYEICRKKLSEGGYSYTPAKPYVKFTTNDTYFASLKDAVDDYAYSTFTLLDNVTLTENVEVANSTKTTSFSVTLGSYSITAGEYKIVLHADKTAKFDKAVDFLALYEGETGTLRSYTNNGEFCYEFCNANEAKVGDTEYDTFAAAASAAGENTITLLRKVVDTYTMTSSSQTLNVAKNGYSITIVGYAGYVASYSTANGITTYKQSEANFEYILNETSTYKNTLSLIEASGTTVKLLKDYSTTTWLTCGNNMNTNRNVTLDLNGKTLSVNTSSNNKDHCFLVQYGCTLTVKNGTIEMTPTSTAKSNGFRVEGGAKLIVASDATINAHDVSAVTVLGTSTLETSGTLTADGNTFTVCGNGSSGKGGYTINITGGSVTSAAEAAIYHPNSGTVTISGGSITGATGIYQKSGTLNITGGTITGNGTKADYVYNGNGANSTGDAVVIDNCGYPGGAPVPTISGGTFTSTNAKAVASYASGEDNEPVTGFISGGTFSSDPTDFVVTGYEAKQDNSTWAVQQIKVAKIGDNVYASLQAAFDAGGAVTLLEDITLESSATVASDKTVTLNLNGKKITSLTADYAIIVEGTLTVNGETDGSVINAFSDKTKKRVFLVKGGQLTINSGTFEGSYPIFVGNGDGSNQPVNGSKVTITGGTFKAQEMCIATRESVNADVNVTGGTFTAIDNAVMGANGTEGFKENQFKISGGTFNGGITSSGYVACGIYAPNNDTWDITGGTFNITGGAGIVQRAGTVNISGDVVFNVTGESSVTGKVGDSRVVVPCSALVFDEKANYPGLTSESKMTVEGGTFTAASGVAAITAVDGTATSRVLVSGGTYSSDPKEFCIDGYSVASDDGKYYVGEVTIPSAPTVSGTNSDNTQATYTVTAVITDDNNNQHSVTTGQPIVVSTDVTGDAGEDVKLGDIKVNDVLTKAIAAVSNSGNDITKVTKVEIGIEASVTAAANTTEKTKAFDVKPVANITVTNAADTKIQLGNEDLTDNATFKFSLDLSDLSLAEGTLVQIVHTSDDPTTYPTETLYASVASGKVNVTTKHFSTFSVSVPAGGTDLASFELTDDGDDYSATHETYPYPSGQNVTGVITYKRAFAAARIGKYQSWFVPFDYVIKEADAAKFNFYKINMVANSAVEGNAETVDANQIWIHLKQMSKDETLYGNMPYVIQPIDGQYTADEVYEFKTSDGTSLKAMNTDAVLSTQTSVATYNFYGTYQNTESTKNHDFLYVNSQGQICWSVYPWSYSIAPYRWIIKMESKGISYAPMLNFVEDDTTGISEKSVANGAYDTSAQYFNMNGQRVQQPTKGLYIVNGKKVIVK